MFLFNLQDCTDIAYDIETYPNCFTFTAMCVRDINKYWTFEISSRKNEINYLMMFIAECQLHKIRWVGFNNLGFDYPVVHFIWKNSKSTLGVVDIYHKAMSIIRAPDNAKFSHLVWESDWLVPQIDLFKIHHFDNRAKSTSLKILEFNMHMDNIEDLPFEVGTELTHDQMDTLIQYNIHDVKATVLFYHKSKEQIKFREELTEKYNKNFINHNDTKIGKDYFIMELEKVNPDCCYKKVDGKKHIVQTKRESIDLGELILPYVTFNDPEFNRMLEWFKDQIITETKGVFKDANCSINGFRFDFGTGGIHGSIESSIIRSDETFTIIDIDVASYYPNLAIANGFYPEHLGQTFCKIYRDMYEMRKEHSKKEFPAINGMLKLALNGIYGDSNNQYSPFYDPAYTMSITINGQLLLCMLAETLMQSAEVQMIQINTDGLTIRCPRSLQPWVNQVMSWWEQLTSLTLETAEYSRMFIRDVNNYIAEYTDGNLKRKGAYEYELDWHQNHSALVVPKAAQAALVKGESISTFIHSHNNVFDFFLRTKVPRSSNLEWGGEKVSNIVRYIISTEGKPLEKVMPPAGPEGAYKRKNGISGHYYQEILEEVGGAWDERIHTKNKSIYEERRIGINTGWKVDICNNLTRDFIDAEIRDYINYEWYIKETEKLVNLMLD